MTLVAAYRPEGIPVLVGDFLITGGGQESTKKKIYKVGPNFAVGWSGPVFVAGPILKSLFAEFENRSVTLTEVEVFFTNRPEDELSSLPFHIIGWVIGEQPHCFLWNILCPTKLFLEPYHIIGSGSKKFQELMSRNSFGGSWGSKQKTTVDQAISSALAKITELYSDENLDRMNRRERFGYGYELIYFDGQELRYLENIAYFGMDVVLDPEDFSAHSQPYQYWYRYHSLSNAAFVQVMNLRTGEMTLDLISPVFQYLGKDAAFEFIAGSFRADYYCIYLRIQTTKGEAYTASVVLPENKNGPSRYEKMDGKNYRFELPQDLIKFLYENVVAQAEHNKTQTVPWGWGAAETVQRMVGAGSSFYAKLAQNDKCVVIGLIGDYEWDKNFASMDHAIRAEADGTLQVFEKGLAVGPAGEPYKPNDLLGIAVEELISGPTVRYYVNSKCIYESLQIPIFPLRGAICLREEGAAVSESQINGKWQLPGQP